MLRGLSAIFVVGALSAGCSFYTSCPTGQPPPANTAASAGTGGGAGTGTAQGGTANGGGAGGNAPTGSWVSATSNLAGVPSECGNMSYLSGKPGENLLIAGVAVAGLFSSSDGGDSWQPLGTGDKSDVITNRASAIVYDPDHSKTFWETGIYNGGGVYRTTDDGETLTQLGDISHDDFISIDFADPDRQTLLVSGHEGDGKLSLSTNGGKTWESLADHTPSQGACSYPILIDPTTFVLGCRNYGGDGGIYRSEDAGQSWDKVSDQSGASEPLFASDGTIYFASDASASLVSSTDQGQTWTSLAASGVLAARVKPVELPDGRLASVGASTVLVSSDGGHQWRPVSTPAPHDPVGLVYSPEEKAFFVWYFTCDTGANPVPDDAIMRYDFDYETE